jgi:hypothetical protein
MLEGSRVQNNIDAAGASFQVRLVADIAQVEVYVIVVSTLLRQEEEVTFVVVDPDNLDRVLR